MIPDRFQGLLAPEGPARELSSLFAGAGFELYLVGGAVRDAMLDRADRIDELDFTTNARPAAIKRLLGAWGDDVFAVGEAFGTVGAIKSGTHVEVTTFRSEVYRDDSRKPVVSYADDVETDLGRRDFTVNAMALALPEATMVDPFGGLADLAAGRLRTPLSPEISFGDDPLRMLRLFRFVAVLGFEPDPEAVGAVRRMTDRLAIVSAERIRDEFVRLIVGDHVAAALEGLVDTGLADMFLPELAALALQQDPMHRHKDVLAHTIAVVAKTPQDPEVRLAALFHDVGKPETREFGPDGVSFHHHEVVGARMTKTRMKELRFPTGTIDNVRQLVYLHMRPHTYALGWSDRAVRRYVRDAGPLLGKLNALVRADVTTRNKKRRQAIERRIDELEVRIAELREQEELDRIRPPIDGNQVMAHLGLKPGPVIGEAMDLLLEHRLDHGPYSEDEAYALLDEWWNTRS